MNQDPKTIRQWYNVIKELLSLSLEDIRLCAEYADKHSNETVRDFFLKASEVKSKGARVPELNLYTVEEVAKTLKVTPRTVMNYIYRGKLPAKKIMEHWLITAEDLAKFAKGE